MPVRSHRFCLDDAIHIDRVVDHVFRRAGSHQDYHSAVGENRAAVADKRFQFGSVWSKQTLGNPVVDPNLDQAVAVEIECERIARGQRYAPKPGADDPAVLNAGRNESDYAAFGRSDSPAIDDRTAWIGTVIEVEPAGNEVLVINIDRGRDQAANVHLGIFAKQDAVGVDEHNPPVGGKSPENVGHRIASDAVERD